MGLPPPAGGHLREPRPLELDTADGPVDAAPRRFAQIESGRAAEQLCDLLLVREIRSKRQTTHRVIHRPPTDLGDESLGFADYEGPTVLCITHVRSKRSDGGSETPRMSRPVSGSLGTLAYLVPTSAGVKLSPGLPRSYRQLFVQPSPSTSVNFHI